MTRLFYTIILPDSHIRTHTFNNDMMNTLTLLLNMRIQYNVIDNLYDSQSDAENT